MESLYAQLRQCDEIIDRKTRYIASETAALTKERVRRAAVKRQIGIDDEDVLLQTVKRKCALEDADNEIRIADTGIPHIMMWKFIDNYANTEADVKVHCLSGRSCPCVSKPDKYTGYYECAFDSTRYWCNRCAEKGNWDPVLSHAEIAQERRRQVCAALEAEKKVIDQLPPSDTPPSWRCISNIEFPCQAPGCTLRATYLQRGCGVDAPRFCAEHVPVHK